MTPPAAIEFVRPATLSTDVGYAYAAVLGPGRTVFTAGACPLDAEGNIAASGDVIAQARQVMANLLVTLQAAGAELRDVAKTTVYVASHEQAELVSAWDTVRAAFGDHDPPSTLVGVTVLGYRHQLVEVEAIAVMANPAGQTSAEPNGSD